MRTPERSSPSTADTEDAAAVSRLAARCRAAAALAQRHPRAAFLDAMRAVERERAALDAAQADAALPPLRASRSAEDLDRFGAWLEREGATGVVRCAVRGARRAREGAGDDTHAPQPSRSPRTRAARS